MCAIYLNFYRACKVQGIDHNSFLHPGCFQPYCAWIGLTGMSLVVTFYRSLSFTLQDVSTFFSYYTMVIVALVLFISWKIIKRTRLVRPREADIIRERLIVELYEESFLVPPVEFLDRDVANGWDSAPQESGKRALIVAV